MKFYKQFNTYLTEGLATSILTSLLHLTFTPPQVHGVRHTMRRVHLMINKLRPSRHVFKPTSGDHTFLSNILSRDMAFYIKTRKLQWNVLDGNFSAPHQLFQNLYAGIEETIDQLSDHINQLGGMATHAIQKGAEVSKYNLPHIQQSQENMMTELLREHATTMARITEEIENSSSTHNAINITYSLLDIMEQHKTTHSTLVNICKVISAKQVIQSEYVTA